MCVYVCARSFFVSCFEEIYFKLEPVWSSQLNSHEKVVS